MVRGVAQPGSALVLGTRGPRFESGRPDQQIEDTAMRARIFQRPKTATQSGQAGAGNWVFEYQPTEREQNDPLMGWWGSGDTLGQVRLRFDSAADAVAFADKQGVPYDLEVPPTTRAIKPKAYADNFRWGRAENWTH